MKLSDINIKEVIDMLWLQYRRAWYWNEYILFENWVLTSWWRFNSNKNLAFDNTWKNRPNWYPLQFLMMYNKCSKEEAMQILSERFYLDKPKRYGRKSNIRF